MKRVLSHIGRLSCRDALLHLEEVLEAVSQSSPISFSVFAREKFGQLSGGDLAGNVSTESLRIYAGFLEDAGGADNCVLGVGPVSPSKLRASLKSKAMTDCLVNFSMK